MDTSQLIGRVRTTFELHSYHGDHWLLAKDDSVGIHEIESAAAALLKRGEVDGIRIARRTVFEDHGFSTSTILMKRMLSGVQEADPLQVAKPGRDASWCDKPEDMQGDIQRQVFRFHFAKYLDERRQTPLEVIYYEVHAKALDGAGTTVQGALQRLASQQVRGTQQTASARMRELFKISEDGLHRLVTAAKEKPPLKLAPGSYAKAFVELANNGPDPLAEVYRSLAAYLADAKSWVEKLDRLFRLFEPQLSIPALRALDSLAAEILASPFALKELAGEQSGRVEMVLRAIDLYAGNLGQGNGAAAQPEGVRALSRLIGEGVLPRTIAELRLGLLRHLYSRLPFKADAGLREEVRACAGVLEHMKKHAPALARDEEILEALGTKVDRIIQPEAVNDLLVSAKTLTAKIDTLLTLVEQVPGDAPKAKLAPYVRPYIVPEELIRESGAASNRAEAVRPMAKVAKRIIESDLPIAARYEMVGILDSALFELIRADLLGNQNLSFTERILFIVRHCGGLPDGRARRLASETLATAMKRPEFILNYLERFANPNDRRDAYFKLCKEMLETKLIDPSLIPMSG